MSAKIAGVSGNQYVIGTPEHDAVRTQYATSSYDVDRTNPLLIVQPHDKHDITLVLEHAKVEKIAVAIRTGGHQYSGASSTSAKNIQLDLKDTFKSDGDLKFFEKDGKALVYSSVCWSLGEFNEFLQKHEVFVPHGQCVGVHVGGHVQTGGYGQLGRSFGLTGDYIRTLEIVDCDGKIKEVTQKSEPELFYALLGGSPGNLGVLTHFTIEVERDSHYQGSRGLRSLHFYSPETLRGLLGLLVEMSDNENLPRNYDYCITVVSERNKLKDIVPNADDLVKKHHPGYFDNKPKHWPAMIIVFAQWVPFSPNDVWDKAWFDRIVGYSGMADPVTEKSMSKLTGDWIIRSLREFDLPYIKRTYSTNSKTLKKDGWVEWVANRVETLVKPLDNNCYISAQFQTFGGKKSQFVAKADNGTAYSWRDATLVCTIDSFYDEGGKKTSEEWQRINDEEGIGPHGKLSKKDRRVLWGSYGEFDLHKVWPCYYEDQAKYDRLGRARQAADPHGTFTPNTFCVKRVPPQHY